MKQIFVSKASPTLKDEEIDNTTIIIDKSLETDKMILEEVKDLYKNDALQIMEVQNNATT